jgi:hypothetical protein
MYICDNKDCKHIFRPEEMEYEPIPDNIKYIQGIDMDKGIPKCPHCGKYSFLGFELYL